MLEAICDILHEWWFGIKRPILGQEYRERVSKMITTTTKVVEIYKDNIAYTRTTYLEETSISCTLNVCKKSAFRWLVLIDPKKKIE